jgi:hypothetical protein
VAQPVPPVAPAAASIAAQASPAEGDADVAEPPRQPPQPAAQTASASARKKTKWGVRIGTYSSKTVSDAMLQQAVAKLPADIKASAQPVSVPLRVHHRMVYKAELKGFDQLGAKKACSILTHCQTVKA